MLQKARSVTTSSRSATAKPEKADDPALTPIQFVKGVGPRLGAVFASRGIETVKDVLHFFPRAYEDRSKLMTVAELAKLEDGTSATVAIRVLSMRKIPTRTGKSILEVRCTDDTGTMSLKWFHAPRGMEHRFQPGTQLIATGAVKVYMGKPDMMHPELTWGVGGTADETDSADFGRVVPIYTEIEGISTRVLRKILFEALQKYSFALTEDMPDELLKKHGLPKLAQAVREIHFPETNAPALVEFNTPAHWRLIYDEFFKFEYLILRQRLRMEKQHAHSFGASGGEAGLVALKKMLPFTLTNAQEKAIQDITKDLAQPHPMNRLIQGDVGSGKTAVAFLSAGCVLAEGGQVALMAPTEILAEQHYKNAFKLFKGKLNVALLTGKSTASERNSILGRLSLGEPILLIGTHALIEEPVVFKNLCYTLIDEQHRFGVEQRRALRQKGAVKDEATGKYTIPHNLILTATPIPRTLALTAYGDLSVTSINELPPGRTPIETKLVQNQEQLAKAYMKIREELKLGHQAYFIYPLVNESEAEGFTQLKSAVQEAERLQAEVFPDYKVGLLHGQMKPEEKARVMEQFQKKEVQVLVSTTVVEVGVDVPNATIMVVEHAERFGLSQLHQLRGRVGRGGSQSYCFLFTKARMGEITAMRLDVLESTNDGFKIAEADLEIRGPGEFLGTRQAGGLPFRMASLIRDRDWLVKAREDATDLLSSDPELLKPEHAPLRRYYEREGSVQFERLKTS